LFGRNGPADGGDISFGGLGVVDDFQMDVDGGGEFNIDVEGAIEDARRRQSKAGSVAPPASLAGAGDVAPMAMEEDRRSRYSTPADGFGEDRETYSDLVCPIAVFDYRAPKDSQQPEEADAAEGSNKDNYSKNTVKALGVLRKHFGPSDQDATPRRGSKAPADKVLNFKKLSEKASRRAAASFFFELLVLGTKDCVKLDQQDKFENIEIRAKDKMWDIEPSRQASVAPSNA